MEVDKQSLWLLHLLQLIHGVSVLTQWKPLSAIALLSGLYVLVHQLRNPPAGNCADVYGFGCILSNVVLSLCTDILFRDADDFTRVERVTVPDSHEKNSDNRSTARTPWQKVVDVLELGFASSRGIGWKFQRKITTVAKPPGYPRWKFVFENLLGIVWQYLAMDLASIYIRSTPLGTIPVTRSLKDMWKPMGMANAIVIFAIVRLSLGVFCCSVAAISVALGIYGPEQWPPMFGSLKDAYTVRRFWAFTWHQMMRRIAEPPLEFFARKVFRIPPRTYLSNQFKVFGAFFVAYVLHGYGSQLAGGSHKTEWDYFMSQAVAIWIEETVVSMALKVGVSRNWRFAKPIGYLWTFLCQGYTLVPWLDYGSARGAWAKPALGFSAIEMLLKRSS